MLIYYSNVPQRPQNITVIKAVSPIDFIMIDEPAVSAEIAVSVIKLLTDGSIQAVILKCNKPGRFPKTELVDINVFLHVL